MYIQKAYYPGDNALERVYLGNPHFGHLTYDFMRNNIKFIFHNREYLYVPMAFTLLLSAYFKNIFLLSSLIAITPWIILSVIAISYMPHTFSNYYTFPFIIMLSWPVFSFAIAKKWNMTSHFSKKNIILSFLLITGSSIVLFPHNSGNADSKPWKNFIFFHFETLININDFMNYIENNKNILGTVLFDEPLAALVTKNLLKSEYGYLNNYTLEQKKRAQTIIFFNQTQALNRQSNLKIVDMILKNHLKYTYIVPKTNIVVASSKALPENKILIKDLSLFEKISTIKILGSKLPSQIDGHIIQTFILPRAYANAKVEIRNFYNGKGDQSIKSLIITKVE